MPTLRWFTTAEAPEGVLKGIRRLLDDAFDGDFSATDWDHSLGGWHVISTDDDGIVAHAAVVPRMLYVGTRPLQAGYVEAVATAPARQHQGIGYLVMEQVGQLVNSDFDIGALSTGAYGFYEQLGWERWQGPTFVRSGSDLLRTEEEDDAVMVLRSGRSAGVDLALPIACERRAGDDW